MNILVTGANGQFGREIREASKIDRDNFLFTDVDELDITNIEKIRSCIYDNSIDIVVNCAAYTNVDCAEDNFFEADLLNHIAVKNIATVCKENDIVLFHISTDYVFQGDINTPYSEDEPTNPLGVYGVTKLAGENRVIDSGCKYIIIRTAWLYSSFGNNFVKTMRKLTSERDSLKVVFDQVGTPTYGADLAEVIIKIIDERLFHDNYGIYNFSNEGVCSWYDFAQQISEISGNKCDIKPCYSSEFPSKVKRPFFSVLDKSKIKHTFNISIPYWRDSLCKCIKILNNR